uniref:Pleckstrin homology and coiled-coil domain containing D1 n=1 Tax=Lepisosteus oculatus TaxID=7918 RepID=W5NA37_LEPOC
MFTSMPTSISPSLSMEHTDTDALDISTKVQVMWKRLIGRPTGKWSKRFFIIKDSFLQYYAENERKNFETNRYFNIHPKVVIPLGGCVVEPKEEQGMPFAMNISHEGFHGNIVLAVESESEQAQWLELLQESGKVTSKTGGGGRVYKLKSLPGGTFTLTKEKRGYLSQHLQILLNIAGNLFKKQELEKLNQALAGEKKQFEEVVQELRAEQEQIKHTMEKNISCLYELEEENKQFTYITISLQNRTGKYGVEKGNTWEVIISKKSCPRKPYIWNYDQRMPASSTQHRACRQLFKRIRLLIVARCFSLDVLSVPRLKKTEEQIQALQEEREFYSSKSQALQLSLSELTAEKQQTEAELKTEIKARVQLEKRLNIAEEALRSLEQGLNSMERSREKEERMKGDVGQLKKFFEECIRNAEIDAKLPAIMENSVYIHKATARRIKSCRIQKKESYNNWGLKRHSQSFIVSPTEETNLEDLWETARRLTCDRYFRESNYKIMTHKDTLKGEDRE